MKVNERTVVGVDWPLCPPTNRGERSTRMLMPNGHVMGSLHIHACYVRRIMDIM